MEIEKIIDSACKEFVAMKKTHIEKINYEKAYMEGYEACYDFFSKQLEKKQNKEE